MPLFIYVIIVFLVLALMGIIIFRRFQNRPRELVQGTKTKLSVTKHLNLEENDHQVDMNNNIQNIVNQSETKINNKSQPQTTKKNKKSGDKSHKEHLIDELAFEFNDDSENEDQNSSSGNATEQHTSKEIQGFTFQQSEHKLEELVAPNIVNTIES